MFFLGIPYRLISFLTVHEVLLAGSSAGVYFCIRVAVGVVGRVCLVQVLLAVVAVCEVGV